MDKILIPFKCDSFIDQGLYIGEDPIGHSCSNDATKELDEILLCDSCVEILKDNPERLSFYPGMTGKKRQIETLNKFIGSN